jgi:plastocyanin
MKRLSTISMIAAVCTFSFAVAASAVHAADDNKLSIPVAFGRGLNIPANQAANQVMIPDTVKLKEDGVVHFLVAGFHEIVIYNPGKTTDDVAVVPGETFIDDANNRFYKGIVPAGGPLGTAPTTNPSNAQNRVESVAFPEPGTYLVICNIRPHFENGMFGFIEVK